MSGLIGGLYLVMVGAVEVDPNGKPMPWLWVTLLPFLDETRLLRELNDREDLLTDEEKQRNSFGPCKSWIWEQSLW